MTAMPPTKGHINLMEFAADLVFPLNGRVTVIVCTQPHEPWPVQRYLAVLDAAKRHSRWYQTADIDVKWLNRALEQNPEAPGFWDMWVEIMTGYGFKPGDFCVTSEPYGATMAELLNGVFMPYDPQRELYYTKATDIRGNPAKFFADIAPEFQIHLRQTVTFFGAESTGKTTLSREMSYDANGHWLFEYARPYLETAENVITPESMTAIWRGQAAIQKHGQRMLDKPWVVQDTDLFTTVGYWQFPHWQDTLGPVPEGLINDAVDLKSNLYIITPSNIPLEVDPLRYKSDVGEREGSDEYWINVAEQYDLNYHVLVSSHKVDRIYEAKFIMEQHWAKVAETIVYDRMGM
jgi:NadR type nicotinamide-nucleotide adenylyltransferase